MTQETETQIEKMFEAGAHYGYSKTRRHPSVAQFIFDTKNRNDFLDLDKTNELLEKAKEFVKDLGAQGKQILFVGTKPEAKNIVREFASSVNMPFVTERWIGGTLTNYTEIKKRIDRLVQLVEDKQSGELAKYTKKEQMLLGEEIEKLERYFGGLRTLKSKPDAIFVIDSRHEEIAVTEANKIGVPLISVSNSDCNIKNIDYPIIANDASTSSITFFIDQIVSAYKN